MKFLAHIARKLRRNEGDRAREALASLVLAARDDATFRQRGMAVLNLSATQRESIVRTAVEEMERNGEPAAMRAAFLVLATSEGAEAAARMITSDEANGGPMRSR